MPSTASDRGLADPFEPLLALRESASYLRELRTTFGGNLGLAAAAYNAGPGRVEAWLAGRGGLPAETRAYVRAVTGHAADAWASTQLPQWQASDIPKGVPCVELAKLVPAGPRPPRPAAPLVRHGARGACSSPATGPRDKSWPPMSGCGASTMPFCATGCRWSCAPASRAVVPPNTSLASRRAAGRVPKRCAPSCAPLAAPASCSAIHPDEGGATDGTPRLRRPPVSDPT